MGMEETLKELILRYGYLALFFLSFTEAIFQPVPPFPFIVSANLLSLDPLLCGLVSLLGNILGSLVSYRIGKSFGKPLVVKLLGERFYRRGEVLFKRYGSFAVLIGEPYKAVCYLSGILGMELKRFLILSLIARSLRIFPFVLLSYLFNQ